jgi:photosystem II stability/assembly factor-like uncharacterized protein
MKLFRPLTVALTVFLSAAPVFAQDLKKEAEPAAFVYEGAPLKLPLECRYADLLRAGLVCNQDVPCDLSLELVGVRGSKTSVFAIGNIYTPAATVSSILLGSHDGGKTWIEAAARIPAASLEIIQFADDENGWVGGQEKDIDDSSLPFFFITQNGGRYWDRRNVWDASADRSGAILDFYFESPRHGFVVIERLTTDEDSYELYETMNGGRSWSPRRISGEKPTIRRGLSVPDEVEWRLSEEKSGETYDIETRDGDAWRKVASFSSDIGACTEMDKGEKKPAETLTQQQPEPVEPADPQRPVEQKEGGVLVVPGAR